MGAQEREKGDIERIIFKAIYRNEMVQALKEVAASGRFEGVTVTTLATSGQEYDLPDTGKHFRGISGQRKGKVPDGMEWVAVADTRGGLLPEFHRKVAAILATRSMAASRRG